MKNLIKIIVEDIGKVVGIPAVLSGNVAELVAQVAEVVIPVAMANPVAMAIPAATGLSGIMVTVGLYTLVARRMDKYNSTMREIQARLERQEEECRRRVAEAQDSERVARTSAIDTEARSRLREEEALAQAQKAEEALQKGIRPVVWPTREQFSAAEQRVEYNPAMFHFAICGGAGSGKSSLINGFRGLKATDTFAAKVGVTECTSEVTRYPDPRNAIVWYDIPGAGTPEVPDWQYFNDQGLFVFDFIVIAYDIRFTEIDVGIIKNCLLFEIPFFVVRSKSDQHIKNMMNDMGKECEDQEVVDKYVEVTRANFKINMEKMAEAPELDARAQRVLSNQRVYIVSGSGLLETASEQKRQSPSPPRIIDEKLLVKDMLKQANRRRCSDSDKLTIG